MRKREAQVIRHPHRGLEPALSRHIRAWPQSGNGTLFHQPAAAVKQCDGHNIVTAAHKRIQLLIYSGAIPLAVPQHIHLDRAVKARHAGYIILQIVAHLIDDLPGSDEGAALRRGRELFMQQHRNGRHRDDHHDGEGPDHDGLDAANARDAQLPPQPVRHAQALLEPAHVSDPAPAFSLLRYSLGVVPVCFLKQKLK